MTLRPKLMIMSAIVFLMLTSEALAQNSTSSTPAPRIFGGARIEDIYRVVLDRDALLLESIQEVIRQKNIQEGQVTVTAGSIQECTFHYVTSTDLKPKDVFKTVKGPYEILNAGGIIAGGEPHIHISIAREGGAAVGGHLEKGCRILYLGELTIVKYAAPPLTRKPNANGIMILQEK
jgi:predicted DNA-binding protein with PD1-like motif